jgi:uncharacterized repeat protein (TIGR01451 family)
MKSLRPRHRIHSVTKLPHLLTRLVLVSSIATLGSGNLLTAVMALPPTPGTVIKNTAVGSFLDEDAPAATTPTVVESNEVTVTVAEIAGITITSGGIIGSTGLSGLAYFDFIITNAGNDPTQFFIPGAPSAIIGGTQSGNIKIISYDSDGDGSAAAIALNVNVPNTIASPGGTTGSTALLGADITANKGSIPAGGTIRIRVPILIDATVVGNIVSVTMGKTTPSNGTSQTYVPVTGTSINNKVYTVDNPNITSGETSGVLPLSAEKESSIIQTLSVTSTNNPDPASAGAPFDCDPYFYMVRNDGSSDSQLYKIDRQSNSYSQSLVIGGGFSPPIKLNALGYNPIDHYFYAMSSSPTSYNVLYRIGKNNAVSLGVVQPNVANNITLSNSNLFDSGTFDSAGNYYVSTGSSLYKIAISGNIPTVISSTTVTGLGSAGDIAFNPFDNQLYAANKSTTEGIYLRRIDNLTGTTSLTTKINISSPYTSVAGSIGSIFFDSVGTLYAYSSSPAYFYQMPNVQSGSTTVTEVSQAIAASSTDGASCPFIPPRIDVVKSVGTVVKVNSTTFRVPFTIKVGNTGSGFSPNVQVTENLAKAFKAGTPTISILTTPPITSTPSGICTLNTSFDGQSTGNTKLLTGTNTLSGGTSCTISFTAQLNYSGSLPTAIQNNSVYASTTINTNPGHTFTNDAAMTPIYPPDLFDADTSTDRPNNAVALPSSTHGDIASPTPITIPIASSPNVLLVKRITAINGQNITTYSQEDTNPYDDNLVEPSLAPVLPNYPTADTSKWPNTIGKTSSTFLVGVIGGTVKPKESIEYTIYFLSTGDSTANNVLLCDRVPANVTFIPNAFNNAMPAITPDTTGFAGADRGIVVNIGDTIKSYTSVADGDDAQYFPPNIEPSTVYGTKINCGGANDNGAVVFNLKNLKPATGTLATDQTNGAYGFVRFRGLVK